MTQAIERQTYTPEEYLELELASENKSEYRNGEIVPMTGGTLDHNELAINLAAFLQFALRGKSYRIFATDQRLWIPTHALYTYPDVMVIENPLQLQIQSSGNFSSTMARLVNSLGGRSLLHAHQTRSH
jgi:Uma2 family endonuclease